MKKLICLLLLLAVSICWGQGYEFLVERSTGKIVTSQTIPASWGVFDRSDRYSRPRLTRTNLLAVVRAVLAEMGRPTGADAPNPYSEPFTINTTKQEVVEIDGVPVTNIVACSIERMRMHVDVMDDEMAAHDGEVWTTNCWYEANDED